MTIVYYFVLLKMPIQTSPDVMNLKVVKSNDLIRAGYKLAKREQLFILYLIGKIDSINQAEFTDFELSYKQIQDIFNFDGVRRVTKRKEVFTLIDNLNKAPIHRENTHNEVKVNRLSSVTHHKSTDTFTLRIDPALKPFLLQLEAFFTEYYYTYISQLDLSSSFRLYELFKSYHSKNGIVEKIYSLEELKFLLGLEGKYQKFYEFKRRILHPSLKEIEEFTDIKASYIIHEKI